MMMTMVVMVVKVVSAGTDLLEPIHFTVPPHREAVIIDGVV